MLNHELVYGTLQYYIWKGNENRRLALADCLWFWRGSWVASVGGGGTVELVSRDPQQRIIIGCTPANQHTDEINQPGSSSCLPLHLMLGKDRWFGGVRGRAALHSHSTMVRVRPNNKARSRRFGNTVHVYWQHDCDTCSCSCRLTSTASAYICDACA